MGGCVMGELKELYKEIDNMELLLAEKRIEYAKKAVQKNRGSIKLKYNPNQDDFDEIDEIFCEQFPEMVAISGRHGDFYIYITEVYEAESHGIKSLFIKGIDTEAFVEYEEFADYNMPEVCSFINYCLKQKENEKEQEGI